MTGSEFLKLIIFSTPKVLLGIFIVCTLLILMPADLLGIIGVDKIKTEYASIIGVTLLLSGSILFSHFLFKAFPILSNYAKNIRSTYSQRKRLRQLTEDEKQLLKKYIDSNTRVRPVSIYSGIATDLSRSGILYRSTQSVQPAHHTCDYTLSGWAYKYLKRKEYLLKTRVT